MDAAVAEPVAGGEALDHRRRVVDPAVPVACYFVKNATQQRYLASSRHAYWLWVALKAGSVADNDRQLTQ